MATAAAAAARSRSSSKELMKVLTTPTKIAHALNWKKRAGGSIATIDVHADRIGLTIAQHPSANIKQQEKPSSFIIPMRRKGKRKVPDSSRQQLSDLVHENNVCGFVVSWPIQKDTGLMGAACGRTLHAIEELLEPPSQPTSTSSEALQSSSDSDVFTRDRKLCLWDGVHMEQPPVDKFGRSSVYSRTCDYKLNKEVHGSGRIEKYEYLASKEQYHEDESIVAAKVWEDFVRNNWPAIYQQQQQQLGGNGCGQYDDYSNHQHQGRTLVTARTY